MPMDFPDMESLKMAAEVWQFRQPDEGESEEGYRNALANHVAPLDIVESQEIRHKVGWDKFNQRQNEDLVSRTALDVFARERRARVCYCNGVSTIPCAMHPWVSVSERGRGKGGK